MRNLKDEKKQELSLMPLQDRVIVRREQEYKHSIIIVTGAVQKISLLGEIVATGPECDKVEVGDTVWFAKYSTLDVPFSGFDNYCLINEPDILTTVKRLKKEKK